MYARDGIKNGFYSQVCFLSQHAAEKAIKAIAFHREFEIRGHSITKIAQGIGINSEIERCGKRLDIYYISSRYPDALPEGAPFEFFTIEQAQGAINDAKTIIDKAIVELKIE